MASGPMEVIPELECQWENHELAVEVRPSVSCGKEHYAFHISRSLGNNNLLSEIKVLNPGKA